MIGVFDSGLGGLTALRELTELLPHEDIVYFGDTGRVPYGSKSPETIIRYSIEDMSFLLTFGVDAVLVACGTASSTALPTLRERFDVPVFGVIDAAAREAVGKTKNGKIGVIGTSATVKSGAFERSIREIDRNVEVISAACPLFVHLVEDGFTSPGDVVTLAAAHRYLDPLADSGIDTLILGCTHYPIISGAISEVLPGVRLISSGRAAAKALAAEVTERRRASGADGKTERGVIRCFVSDAPDSFESSARVFMGGVTLGGAELVDIGRYRAV